ncbi:SPP1 phage holin family protein [Limosilactobacillus reuteri]|uniref:phage holin n=1 Tax=Limosilactobacillus reuteri TaxID=1598 RepID=UPI001E323312|nr:phage holin [Limosilactobacillus reuteri]MCC4326068.1 SPP1 phage holin family protein [Limosilactobacillus reuteri]MCC4329818.1 SPP1 phage holin family protein [Limosilactobacillus reuteri]
MTKIKAILKNKFINQDGTINKTSTVSLITLLIVLVNQILLIFGITPIHEDQSIAIINTILTIASLLGFVEPSADHNNSGSVTPTITKTVSTNLVSPSEIKTLTSLASQVEQLESQSIASVSASVLADQKLAQNSAKSAE